MLGHCHVVILYELGCVMFEAHAAHLFFQLVSRRHDGAGILNPPNRAVGQRNEVFGEAVVATAIRDRLLHQSHVVTTGNQLDRQELTHDQRLLSSWHAARPSVAVE